MSHTADLKFLIVDDFSTKRRIVRELFREMGRQHAEEADDVGDVQAAAVHVAGHLTDIMMAQDFDDLRASLRF